MALKTRFQLPKALKIRKIERREVEPATQNKFKIFVEGSLGQAILQYSASALTAKTTANFQVQIPEKRPLL